MHRRVLANISQRLLLIETICYLVLARLALLCLPFNRLVWFLNRPARQPELEGEERELLRKTVRWTILRAVQLLVLLLRHY